MKTIMLVLVLASSLIAEVKISTSFYYIDKSSQDYYIIEIDTITKIQYAKLIKIEQIFVNLYPERTRIFYIDKKMYITDFWENKLIGGYVEHFLSKMFWVMYVNKNQYKEYKKILEEMDISFGVYELYKKEKNKYWIKKVILNNKKAR